MVMINNKRNFITNPMNMSIEEDIYKGDVAQFIGTKESNMGMIDWQSHKSAMKRIGTPESRRKLLW